MNKSNGQQVEFASIKGQASKKYFYGDAHFEKIFSKIDELYGAVLGEIRKMSSLSEYSNAQYLLLLQCITLQKARTESSRFRNQQMNDQMMRLYAEMRISQDSSFSETEKTEAISKLNLLKSDPLKNQMLQMSTAVETADCLVDLMPLMLVNKTTRPFIFSDAPVIYTNPYMRNIKLRGVLGNLTPGLVVLIPLGPKLCFMLIDKARYQIKGIQDTKLSVKKLVDVAAINKLQIHSAKDAVYFSSFKYLEYIKGLWTQVEDEVCENINASILAPCVDVTGEQTGEIFHAFERQLPYIPRFTFLKNEELNEENYEFSTRGNI